MPPSCLNFKLAIAGKYGFDIFDIVRDVTFFSARCAGSYTAQFRLYSNKKNLHYDGVVSYKYHILRGRTYLRLISIPTKNTKINLFIYGEWLFVVCIFFIKKVVDFQRKLQIP